jgi:hypothetical protein
MIGDISAVALTTQSMRAIAVVNSDVGVRVTVTRLVPYPL